MRITDNKKKLMLPPAPSPTPKPAPTTPQTKSSSTAGIEPLDLSIRGSSMPANPVSTPNFGPGSPVSSPFGNTTPSWANDSLNGLANWIHSVDTPDKPPTNLDTDSDCIMIVDEETTTKPKTTESKPETSGSSAPVHRPVKSIPETSKSKPEPTESKSTAEPTESKSLFQNMSMLLAIYETSPLPKLNKDRLSLRPKAQPIKR
nr:flocculation protein FLO11-like [Aedes albopictus]